MRMMRGKKIIAGADYLQLYTQFIYKGPAIISEIVVGLDKKAKRTWVFQFG